MKIVTTLEQIEKNIVELERGRAARGKELEEYRALIKRGTCFLPYESQRSLSFAPSRFVGYIDNKLAIHANNPKRDGRITNVAINGILGARPSAHTDLEQAYKEFCETIGVTPAERGAFGIERKYWIATKAFENFGKEKRAESSINQDPDLSETERQQLVRARIGQGVFREKIITEWRKCCVTGCDYVGVLRASHIKPWRDSTNGERLDKFNGLLLSPNLDVLFDKGLISFGDNGEVLISSRLPDSTRKALGCPKDAKVRLQPEHEEYMKWHRKNVFLGRGITTRPNGRA
ncbi:HNH endonuclease [Nitrosomonas cryotolerans]|uniref:HNH endonuclease n=1 Tax=Nitrosomonas cryotolerans ATCC 49181 TaxID=1131553 RepID=A0A1N6IAJ6_9PROT|nr:HNH endonuclease [Nitrosomonas cryotolerans]SFQ02433.1 HNH endonuclease [Nitrosomonas cryotolerans]SIO29068.1 HNH endonuclease [Nitrosomonas cryotolerans ATCC 49181]